MSWTGLVPPKLVRSIFDTISYVNVTTTILDSSSHRYSIQVSQHDYSRLRRDYSALHPDISSDVPPGE